MSPAAPALAPTPPWLDLHDKPSMASVTAAWTLSTWPIWQVHEPDRVFQLPVFDGALNVDVMEFQTFLVPYLASTFLRTYSPLPAEKAHREKWVNVTLSDQMVKNGKFVACHLLLCENQVPMNVTAAVAAVKSKCSIQCVNWCPTGLRASWG